MMELKLNNTPKRIIGLPLFQAFNGVVQEIYPPLLASTLWATKKLITAVTMMAGTIASMRQ